MPDDNKNEASWPADVKDLLLVDVTYKDWDYDNRKKNKFAIVNGKATLAAAGLNPNQLKQHLKTACDEVLKSTKWREQWPNFEWGSCGPKQVELVDKARPELMHFERAVTVITAIDIAARAKQSAIRPIAKMRILPVSSYIENFDKERLKALRAQTLPDLKAPDGAVFTSFDEFALYAMGQQPTNRTLLDEIVTGRCITQFAAEKLRDFVRSNYPRDFDLGEVRHDADHNVLGTKRGANTLKLPNTIETEAALDAKLEENPGRANEG